MKILFQDPLDFWKLIINKAFGLDKISARLLKDSVDLITPSLTNLQINIVYYLHESELQKNAWNVNFSMVLCTIFISNTHPITINRLWKEGAALVNTISSYVLMCTSTSSMKEKTTSKISVVIAGVSSSKIAHAQLSNTAAPRYPFYAPHSLRSKRFRSVSEQRKTEEWESQFWPREKWNKSQKMKVGGGGGAPGSFTCAIFRAVFDSCSSFFVPKPHRNACYAGYAPHEINNCYNLMCI